MVRKLCNISEISEILKNVKIPANPAANPHIQHLPERTTTKASFQINSAKLYVPLITLSVNGIVKFLENIKQGFKRTISWNKYRS